MDTGVLAAALLWLRNQYEDASLHSTRHRQRVLNCIDELIYPLSPITPDLLTDYLHKEMPMASKSPKQARLMAACSHGASYAKCPPKKVAAEFNRADKGTGILKPKGKKR